MAQSSESPKSENIAHGHEHEHDHDHDHPHHHAHPHVHSAEEKKRQINRISRAAGHLQHVKEMIERDEDCSDVLIQLSAVQAALNNLGKEIIDEHISHCIYHAIEDGDTTSVEEFRKAIKKFI